MLKKSIHGFFSYDLREVNSRKSFKSLDFKYSRFGGASLHRTSRPAGLFSSNLLIGILRITTDVRCH